MSRRPGPTWVAAIAVVGATVGWPATSRAIEGAWLGGQSRLIFLHPEQRRGGLDGPDLLFGIAGGVEKDRWSGEIEVGEGRAVERLDIDGVQDPRLRIWSFAAGVRVRPNRSWPVTAAVRSGFWHFDYRDEQVILAFPGLEPTPIDFKDFTEPMVGAAGGLDLSPLPWLALTVEGGVMGLRLNETRIDGDTATVTAHWRASPTAAVGVRLSRGRVH